MTASADSLAQFRQLVADDLEVLAVLHDRELDEAKINWLIEAEFPAPLGLLLNSPLASDAQQMMVGALQSMPRPIDTATLDELAADYAAIYLNHAYRASPTESPWFDDDRLVMQGPTIQVREFYRRHHLVLVEGELRPDDHIVMQLRFIAHLIGTGSDDESLREAGRFMDDHILRWAEKFAQRVAARCLHPFYAALALLTVAHLDTLRDLLAALLDEIRPTAEEIEDRLRAQGPACPPVSAFRAATAAAAGR